MKITTKSYNGAASMFVVIFTTLLLSIIALGFVNIMISEANQTTNFDLSQSAYDSALAGIEDAKIAMLKYRECTRQGATNSQECQDAIRAMNDTASSENCDIISEILSRPNDGTETIIQSESGTDMADSGYIMHQAYTCVKMTDTTDDYLGSLSQSTRTKIIPIRAADISKIDRVQLEWYNSQDDNKVAASDDSYNTELFSGNLTTNKQGYGTSYSGNNATFGNKPTAPPTIQFQLIQTATNFTLDDLNRNRDNATDRGTLLLRPSTAGTNLVDNSATTGLASSADKSFNNPIDISCNNEGASYRCSTDIVIPNAVDGSRNAGTMFVRLVLPYSSPDTSFSLALFNCGANTTTTNANKDCERIQFEGVQTKVDSTGRANDLFRRVEARLEMTDIYYPFPEFSADLGDKDAAELRKNFWVTKNCWRSGPGINSSNSSCDNAGEVD